MKLQCFQGLRFGCSIRNVQAILLIIIIVTVCIMWPLLIYWIDNYQPPVMVFMSDHEVDAVRNQSVQRILYWNTFHGRKDFYFGYGTQMFADGHCNVTCETTNDRSKYNTSTAIVFHIQDIRLSDMPKYRFPHQRWIFFLMEPPQKLTASYKLHDLNNTFNWTMTYRHDSDVLMLYGKFDKLSESLPKTALYTDNFTKRTKGVMWVVSECRTWGKREWYVRELKKHIEVDIYGHCGTSCKVEGVDECETVHLSTYKFYLAFENSRCREYNTEKFYRGARKQGPIPIVYGGSNYSAIAPPKYYIDTKDFASPKDLADYLNVLSKNASMYNEYNDWRSDYVVNFNNIGGGFCNLCQKMNGQNEGFFSYPDIYNWWITEGNCV